MPSVQTTDITVKHYSTRKDGSLAVIGVQIHPHTIVSGYVMSPSPVKAIPLVAQSHPTPTLATPLGEHARHYPTDARDHRHADARGACPDTGVPVRHADRTQNKNAVRSLVFRSELQKGGRTSVAVPLSVPTSLHASGKRPLLIFTVLGASPSSLSAPERPLRRGSCGVFAILQPGHQVHAQCRLKCRRRSGL